MRPIAVVPQPLRPRAVAPKSRRAPVAPTTMRQLESRPIAAAPKSRRVPAVTPTAMRRLPWCSLEPQAPIKPRVLIKPIAHIEPRAPIEPTTTPIKPPTTAPIKLMLVPMEPPMMALHSTSYKGVLLSSKSKGVLLNIPLAASPDNASKVHLPQQACSKGGAAFPHQRTGPHKYPHLCQKSGINQFPQGFPFGVAHNTFLHAKPLAHGFPSPGGFPFFIFYFSQLFC